jgi:hypothetical protein
MNISITKIAMPLLFAVLLASCVTVTHTSKKATFTPDKVELRINISDLKFLGESEITVSYHTYLGFISVIDSINGQPYDPTTVKKTNIEGLGLLNCSKIINRALYKVVEEFPNATYYKVVYNRKVIDRLFLGREIKQTVKIHAYSFK